MVGGLAAQSCGEPTTQLTLNTFHSSGVQHDVSQGVPRLKELLNITTKSKPKTPVMSVTLKQPGCYDCEAVTAVARTLPVVVFHTLVKTTLIEDTPLDELDSLHARVFHDLDVAVQRRTLLPSMIMFALDAKAITVCGGAQELAVCISDFVRKLLTDTTMVCHVIATPTNIKPQIRLRFSDTSTNKRRRSAQKALDARLTNIQHRVLNLEVSGVHDIESTQVVEKQYDGEPPKFEILCRGVNIPGTLHTQHSLDPMSVVCNDVVEIAHLYGLEAAAKALFYEIKSVLSGDSNTLHDRHILMIVDTMTRSGHLMPMNRYGLNKRQTGPLVRSSFEQTVDVFNEAAVFSERDTMAGVSENVMAGQLAPLGTGCIDVLNAQVAQSRVHDEGDTDIVVSTMGDHLDELAVQYEPCLPHIGPDLHADVPSLPCGDFVMEHGMEFVTHHQQQAPSTHSLAATVTAQQNVFPFAPRSPLVHRSTWLQFAPRSP
jgi:DNA-directed RNA polymerase II subunit RPB1